MAVCKRFKQFMLGALNESEQSPTHTKKPSGLY